MSAQILKKPRSKHQERTEATQDKLLLAAEEIFTRDGFADAKLEQIAELAGYTRGAIYAHYKSKEDLFLVLFERRAQAKAQRFRTLLETFTNPEERVRKFRELLVTLAADRSWSILILEFKLFALRRPRLRARMRRIHAMLHTTSKHDFLTLLFGDVKPAAVHGIERRFSLIGSIMSAAVLESHFRPELLSEKDLHAVLTELFETMIHR